MSATARDFSSAELALRLHQQKLVAEFGLFAMAAGSLDEILDQASIVAAQGLDAHFAKVLEYLPGEMAFLVRAGVGWEPEVIGNARVGGDLQSPAGYAFRSGKPVISNHLANEERFRTPKLLADHGIRSAINVLVSAPGAEPYGVLEGDSTDRHDFGVHDLAFLQTLANTLAVSIETQKRADTREELLAAQKTLLEEKDLLLREVHHRVGNSLQLVRTLLTLQARTLDPGEGRSQLEQAADRIMTVGAVHKRLYQGASVTTTDAVAYLRGLIEDMGGLVDGRAVTLDAEPLTLAGDDVTSLGLLTGELLTNALKYGAGDVTIGVRRVGGAVVELSVSDQGAGFPPGFDPAAGRGLGMRLVAALARTEDAITIDRSAGHGRIVVRLGLGGA